MMAEARYYPQARQDLIDQATYLLENASLEVAERFLDAAEQTGARLAETPRLGRVWEGVQPQLRERLRIWAVEGFPKVLIFYRPEMSGISVVRVLHAARDLPPLLEGIE